MAGVNDIVSIIFDLIFQPGSSLKLVSIRNVTVLSKAYVFLSFYQVPVINIAILALLVLMCCLTYSKIDSIHIIVMSTLALGLLASVNW